ncbi:glutathione ABC transporter substrate-binding protein [Halalkalibacter alkalisediminis]|uniref:Glutathione ABC transporter substrate-binding protein n=1 Tax=Halalkalibacter alkalisediminis TaxID=935616 RepID=A0ABV6NJF7_9BACI|nr:glutathione ABC transporter substrate-binding protein [Halalkalibacter alkalisediminis]
MKMSKNSFFFMVLVLSVFIAACASEPDATPAPTDEAGEETTDGATEGAEGGDLVIATLSDAVSLDPHGSNDVPSGNVATNIYETLVYYDENMQIQEGLAESWEQVDELTLKFVLKEGIKFHDGSDFNAEVVKANIERITDPDIASQRAFLFNDITEIEVLGDYEIQFKTEEPKASLIFNFAHSGGGMISSESIAADYEEMENGGSPGATISAKPVGTGFFKFDSWDPGTAVKLIKNTEYWGEEKAKLDSVTFKVVPEDLTRVAELETGEAHVTEPLSPSDYKRVEGTDGIHVVESESLSLSYIGFNTEKEPFNDPKVRQAISMAIDKDAVVEGVFNGVGIPAKGPIAPGVVGHSDEVSSLPYDVEKAKELLAEAGYPDGFSTTISTNDNRERQDLAVYTQAVLSEIGIDVSINVVEWGAYLEQTANGQHDMFILGWSSATGDADYALAPLFHSENVGAPGNRTFYKNDEVDSLLENAAKEVDQEQRLQLYKEVQELLVDEAPMIYIHHKIELNGVRDEVQGFWRHPTGYFQLKDVTIQ